MAPNERKTYPSLPAYGELFSFRNGKNSPFELAFHAIVAQRDFDIRDGDDNEERCSKARPLKRPYLRRSDAGARSSLDLAIPGYIPSSVVVGFMSTNRKEENQQPVVQKIKRRQITLLIFSCSRYCFKLTHPRTHSLTHTKETASFFYLSYTQLNLHFPTAKESKCFFVFPSCLFLPDASRCTDLPQPSSSLIALL